MDRFDEIVVFEIDLRVPFRGIDHRQGVLLRRGDRWSEWSPYPEYPDAEAAVWLGPALIEDDPPLRRLRVPINVLVPVVSPMRAADMVTSSGCRTAKVKVGDPRCSIDDDLARIAAVRKALGPEGHIRVDANGAWTVEQAMRSLAAMARFKLQYAEQPCATVEELAELRSRMTEAETVVKIAADESIRRGSDPLRVAELGAVDVVVLKNQPLGGWRNVVQMAEELDLPVAMSSALETSIGVWQGAQAAAALPELELACGFNTVRLLTDDVLAEPLAVRDGYLEINRRPVPDPKALRRIRASRERYQWWRERLVRCLAIHDEQG